jgi:diguanylate cyclase (GGDEF)-like protein
MTPSAGEHGSPPLVTLVRLLLAGQGLDEVRDATAHCAQLVVRYDSFTLYEVGASGGLGVTLRRGTELGPGAVPVEAMLCERAAKLGATVSTLDMGADARERALLDEYARHHGLCLVRPLRAYGELVGLVAFHYANRVALTEAEFGALRSLVEFAAVALSNARSRTELRNFAYSDALTGLPNRRWLEQEFSRLRGSIASVLLVDFDGLKTVNDSLGYDRGDALIEAVGSTLADCVRPGESVVRYGGDEFVLVMPGMARTSAVRRADELTALLDTMTLPDDLAELFRGASVGSATAAEDDDLWEVLRRASAEMRSRKRRRKTDRDDASDLDLAYPLER